MISTTALVLAGGSLTSKCLGPAPPLSSHPAQLADGSGWALNHICSQLQQFEQITSIQVVIDTPIPTFRPIRAHESWQWNLIPPQISVLASIETALCSIRSEQVLLQPITTLPPQDLPDGTWIGLGFQALPRENWSAVQGPLTEAPQFYPKCQLPDTNEPDSHPFTGLLSAPTLLLRDLLKKRHLASQWSEEAEHDLLFLAEQLWRHKSVQLQLMPWLDLGHRATANRRRLSRLSSRGFNRVEYCSEGDLIRKHSSDTTRLQQEAAYFNSLPSRLQRFFPAYVSLVENEFGISQLELEYVPFPSLAELFLHWRIGANSWQHLIQRLNGIHHSIAKEQAEQPAPIAKVHWLYSQKLKQRLQKLTKQPPELSGFGSWKNWWYTPWELEILPNSKAQETALLNLQAPSSASAALLEDLPILETAQPLQRIHGDLCFNNILAEPLSGSIRLIDPRGERPEGANWPIGYGDPRYDLVKLLHSSRYLYDVVVNDLFELTIKAPGCLQLRMDVPAHYSEVNRPIEQMMLAEQLSREEERLLTASLFFSMLPLHREDGERCLVFTAIGLMILSKQFDAVLIAGGQAPIDR